MEIVSVGPLPVASTVWQPAPRSFALTVVCRATFQLVPVEAELAAEQDALNEEDTYWNDDPTRSLSAPSDLAPFKPRADVILVGYAFAPRREPARSVVARLKVGDVDKSIEVFGERSFTQEGKLREGPRFLRIPLQWERAAGGPDTNNPVGMRLDVEDSYGATALPHLQPLGLHLDRRGDRVPPVGFGPIAPWWPSRRERLGRHAAGWSAAEWMNQPVPPDLDPAYFNSAPRDQQMEVLRDDEQLILENLHPDHPRLVTSLPGLRPRARVERRDGTEDVPMRADTLWIDSGRGVCTLTWRGRVALERRDEAGRVVVELDASGRRAPLPSQHLEIDAGLQTLAGHRPAPSSPALPFVGGVSALSYAVSDESTGDASDTTDDAEGMLAAQLIAGARSPLPFVLARPAPAVAPSPSTPPPALVSPPRSGERIGPRVETTPWAGSQDGGRRFETAVPVAPPLVIDAGPAPEPAASPEARVPAPRGRTSPRQVVKVVWFDPVALTRIRKQREWRRLLGDLELRLLEEAEADVAGGPTAPDVKDRRTVLEVLLHGEAIVAEGVKQAVEAAIREDGGFEPPLVILNAELEMPFDEIETLKATAVGARPLAGADKRLKETLDVVDQLLASPGLGGSGGIAESLTARLREAFAQGKRPLPPDYLEAQAERMLLEQRAYQQRALYDKRWVRSVMRGGAGAIPVYLPDEMKLGLPMFRRFQARMLAELDLREDEGETSPWSVRVLALGRVMTQGA